MAKKDTTRQRTDAVRLFHRVDNLDFYNRNRRDLTTWGYTAKARRVAQRYHDVDKGTTNDEG